MTTESHGHPEGWDAPVPDRSGGFEQRRPGSIGGGAEDVQDVEETDVVPADTDAERLRADDVDQPGDVALGAVGDTPALTDAERLRADGIDEPAGLPEGVVGDSRLATDAERLRSDDIVEPGGVEETTRFDDPDRLDFEGRDRLEEPDLVDPQDRRRADQPGDYDQLGD